MKARPVQRLRLRLPAWAGEGGGPVRVHCGWRAEDGSWHDEGEMALAAIAERFAARRVEAALHPADTPMRTFVLPPLTGRRLREAVLGAVEPCALQPVEQLVVAFGPRDARGQVPTAWVARDTIEGWRALLHRHGLPVRELHLPPAFLPMAAEGGTAWPIERWLIVRMGATQGFVHWLPEGEDRALALAAQAGDAAPEAIRWLDDEPADAAHWSGEGWGWALPAGEAASEGMAASLALPALGWGALALLVWLTVLNVQADRLAARGQGLKRQMAARVQAAFPDIPVVVDPLKQARQHEDARAAGDLPATGSDYAGLSQAAASLLAEVPAGQVQRLDYAAGTLRLRWREGGAPVGEAWRALQARGRERGWVLEGDAAEWRLGVAAGDKAAAPAAQGGP